MGINLKRKLNMDFLNWFWWFCIVTVSGTCSIGGCSKDFKKHWNLTDQPPSNSHISRKKCRIHWKCPKNVFFNFLTIKNEWYGLTYFLIIFKEIEKKTVNLEMKTVWLCAFQLNHSYKRRSSEFNLLMGVVVLIGLVEATVDDELVDSTIDDGLVESTLVEDSICGVVDDDSICGVVVGFIEDVLRSSQLQFLSSLDRCLSWLPLSLPLWLPLSFLLNLSHFFLSFFLSLLQRKSISLFTFRQYLSQSSSLRWHSLLPMHFFFFLHNTVATKQTNSTKNTNFNLISFLFGN